MRFLPFERFTITTTLRPKEVYYRLVRITGPRRQLTFWSTPKKPYHGKIEGKKFEISRAIGYRNSFLPIIKGEFKLTGGNTEITVSMKPHIFIILFMIFWLGGVGYSFAVNLDWAIYYFFTTGQTNFFSVLHPAGMFLFGYLLTMGGFVFEARKSKKFLIKLLNAERVKEHKLSIRKDEWDLNQETHLSFQ